MAIPANVVLGAKIELAKRDLWRYCNLKAPDFYKPDRDFLKVLCEELQDFYFTPASEEPVMIVAAPPRHGKSRTAGNFVEWVFGQNPAEKIMTGSYNETLSTTFSKQVRGTIQAKKADPNILVYTDIFPGIAVKYGDAAMNLWALTGQHSSYLATSPSGTATGFGASLLIIDDIIKNAQEALNENVLDAHWQWFTDTMLSRLEEGGKIILIMTRWATGDLSGRVEQYFKDQGIKVRKLILKAVQEDGSMLCPEILSKETYKMKTAAMSEEIASANYQQEPIDLKGRLYPEFKTYIDVPKDENGNCLFTAVKNYTDTADTGADYLCSITYGVYQNEAYVLDVIYTQAPMEETEKLVAEHLYNFKANIADIESNNGGRGFARAVERILGEVYKSNRTTIKWFHQSQNKVARILSNSSWVLQHIRMPVNWRDKWPEYYRDMTKYQKAGKNRHDDAPDATTGVAESFNKLQKVKVGKKSVLGLR